jgi:hypothetical protein
MKRHYLKMAALGFLIALLSIVLTGLLINPFWLDFNSPVNILLGWPLVIGLPGSIAGLLVARSAGSRGIRIAGLLGISLGVIWGLHLTDLDNRIEGARQFAPPGMVVGEMKREGNPVLSTIVNAESWAILHGGVVADVVILALPVLVGLLGVAVAKKVRT